MQGVRAGAREIWKKKVIWQLALFIELDSLGVTIFWHFFWFSCSTIFTTFILKVVLIIECQAL